MNSEQDADANMGDACDVADPPAGTEGEGVLQPPQQAVRERSIDAPAIRTLTSDDPGMRAREEAYDAQLVPFESTWARWTGNPAPEEDERAADAHRAAYAARRDAKRKARKATLETRRNNFLSQVPEVEEDVQYRFTFPVLGEGSDADLVVQKVCASAAASSLPKQLLDKEDSEELQASDAAESTLEAALMQARNAAVDENTVGSPGGRRRRQPNAMRCLAVVENPLVAQVRGTRELAKLVFHPIAFTQDVPKCNNRQETLSTTVVSLLRVDRPTLPGQLAALGLSVERMRKQSRARLRPVRAVILCAATDSLAAGDGAEADGWAALLAEFEGEHGELWKFGPVAPEDGDALHAAFSEIASVRITSSKRESAKEEDDEELDDAGEPDDQETTEDLALDGHDDETESVSGSQCSEGWHRPPVFETEIDGSEVSENEVEFHTRMFSLGEVQADGTAVLDANPPLAGKTLSFESELVGFKPQPQRGLEMVGWGGKPLQVPIALADSAVSSVFRQPRWPQSWPYSAGDFSRQDESDDVNFYDEPRFVTHIDDGAIGAIRDFYALQFARAPQGEYSVLDICSSWISHYPQELRAKRVAITGMVEKELAANKQATEYKTRNLNLEPKLPYKDNEFDFITNVVSVDYLNKPREIFQEMHRVMKPGGVAIMSFSNRCFPSKAISMWLANMSDGPGHCQIVGNYFHFSPEGGWKDVCSADISPKPGRSDPMWVVTAVKA